MTIEVTLDVALKGADLVASTARIALRDKMGMGEGLAGLARLERYRFVAETSREPHEVIAALENVFDRRSTYYNRNKHEFALVARWESGAHTSGAEVAALRTRFVCSIGRGSGEPRIVELTVIEDDGDDVRGLGEKIQRDLAAGPLSGAVRIRCTEAGTVWWLALAGVDDAGADDLARKVALTRTRDEGLLANPAYQRVDFGPVVSPASFVESSG